MCSGVPQGLVNVTAFITAVILVVLICVNIALHIVIDGKKMPAINVLHWHMKE